MKPTNQKEDKRKKEWELDRWKGAHMKKFKVRRKITNAEFVKTDHFKTACELLGIPATIRQASKFRNGRGKAFEGVKNVI